MNYTVADLIFYKAFGKIKEYRHTNGKENKQVTKL
ncbi:6-carboxy-5,6,7,8-tetrahydropterin synthase [Bacillus phage BSTP10]|nr:6-carboxy-5,6,7,8-tetrahydropterin synthase [Bacillus phage BSTP10]